MLQLDETTIARVLVHQIPSRAKDKTLVDPTGGDKAVALTDDAKDMVAERITKALGDDSHGLKADFRETGAESVFQYACEMMDCDESRFVELSKLVARQLAVAQLGRPHKKCKLIVIQGTVTAFSRPYVALIKAELQEALTENKSVIDHLKDIFMTESQRLYKIGFIHRLNSTVQKPGHYNPEHHAVHIFDHLLTGMETRSAAFYFYSQFLGADLAASDRSLTRDFLEKTLEYVNKENFPMSTKIDLREALRSELRSQDQSISVAGFSKKHMPKEHQSLFNGYMKKAGFPTHAINKDVEYVKQRLKRRRKTTFSSGVQLTTPADQKDLVQIKGTVDGATIVHIQGTVASDD